MSTIIVCAFVIVLIALFSEIRIAIKTTENLKLEAIVIDSEKRFNRLRNLSEDMLEDYEALYDVMTDHFTDDEIDEMVFNKKNQLLEDEVNE
jgi:hypothetical protein